MNRLQKCCLWLAAGLVVGLAIGAWFCHTRYSPCLAKRIAEELWDTPIDPPVTQEWWYCGA